MKNKYHVLIPCAGNGSRFGASIPKQYYPLLNKTILDWTLLAFIKLQPEYIASINVIYDRDNALIDSYKSAYPMVNFLPNGGVSRAVTVFNGLSNLFSLSSNCQDWVLVHDAARCLIDKRDVIRLIEYSEVYNIGCILATKAIDTIKQVSENLQIKQTICRNEICLAQTPQLFEYSQLYNSLVGVDLNTITDEASAVELSNGQVGVVLSNYPNFKITYLDDLKLAEIILKQRLGGE